MLASRSWRVGWGELGVCFFRTLPCGALVMVTTLPYLAESGVYLGVVQHDTAILMMYGVNCKLGDSKLGCLCLSRMLP